MKYQILQGDNRETLKTIPDNSIDAIVTDPPYGIDFLGKAWDANTGALETYQECLRVLKPGGHILAFSAARTYHHLAITLEQAGFEIRDQIMWIYSSGFPKSQDVGRQIHKKENGKPDKQRFSKDEMTKEGDNYRHNTNNKLYRILPDINGDRLEKSHEGESYGYIFEEIIEVDNEWSGWGTALKPAHEPIALARKPIKVGSIQKNVQKYGTGALNIDACRVPYESEEDIQTYLNNKAGPAERGTGKHGEKINMFEKSVGYKNIKKTITREEDLPEQGRFPSNVIGEISEPYQKYFYCPKVSRKERHTGFELPPPMFGDVQGCYDENGERYAVGLDARTGNVGNNHPTVKPVELMKYLIKLVTPPNGIVLDPFNGSGSTGMAAVELGHEYIGCELDPNYVEIAKKRIAAWNKQDTSFEELFE